MSKEKITIKYDTDIVKLKLQLAALEDIWKGLDKTLKSVDEVSTMDDPELGLIDDYKEYIYCAMSVAKERLELMEAANVDA